MQSRSGRGTPWSRSPRRSSREGTTLPLEGTGFSPCQTSASPLQPSLPMRRPARLRGDGYSSPQACFVTFCTWQRRPLLAAPSVADAVTEQLITQAARHAIDITAYCLMPDHLHALLTLEREGRDVRACVERMKQLSAYEYTRRTHRRLWQRSYFDYTLRSHEAIEPTVAYIVNNPVRAGFVLAPNAWPFWGSSRWTRTELLETIATCGPGRRPG